MWTSPGLRQSQKNSHYAIKTMLGPSILAFFVACSLILWRQFKWYILRSPLDNIPGPPRGSFLKGEDIFYRSSMVSSFLFRKHASNSWTPFMEIYGPLDEWLWTSCQSDRVTERKSTKIRCLTSSIDLMTSAEACVMGLWSQSTASYNPQRVRSVWTSWVHANVSCKWALR